MCGIAGIIGRFGSDLDIKQMLNRIKHRGPDGLFYWNNYNIAFGHARLSIIDLSTAANQPMVDPNNGNVVIFNGEIYNYIEIRKTLEPYYSFKTNSDTEVILAAYDHYGIKFLSHLRGMFSFALFNPAINKVLLARDRFGIKPLYYRKSYNGSLLFASEIKSLINFSNRSESINQLKAFEFISDAKLDTDHQTMFEGVVQLLPAHFMWVDASGNNSNPKRYWNFPEVGDRLFDNNAKDELIAMMDEDLKLHLRSDVAVGSFLSGGLDSSSITCFALRNMVQPELKTFSAILPYFHSENSFIKEVVNSSSAISKNDFHLTGEKFFDEIPQVIFHHDEPLLDGSMYTHYKLCSLAHQSGVKVLLSGSGGDEIFGGYESYIHARNARLLRSMNMYRYIKDLRNFKSQKSSNSYNNLFFKSVYECLPVNVRRKVKNLRLKSEYDFTTITTDVPHFYHASDDSYMENLLNNYRSWTAPPFLHYEDRNSMAFGVEIRVPFFDHKLIEFVLQFRPEDLVNGRSKTIIRDSFTGIVPDAVLQQKGKYGFPSPIDHHLCIDEEGRQIFFDLCKHTEFLDPKKTEQLGIDFYSGKANLVTYWRTLSYIMWYHIFFKNWNGFF